MCLELWYALTWRKGQKKNPKKLEKKKDWNSTKGQWRYFKKKKIIIMGDSCP